MKMYKLRASGGPRVSVHRPAPFLATAVIAAGGSLGLAASAPRSAAAAGYGRVVLKERSLVSYWRAAERPRQKKAADRGRANIGRYKHGPRRGVRGLVAGTNTAVKYDGSNDQIRVRDHRSLDLRRAFTLEAWIKPLSARRRATIIRKNKAYLLRIEGANLRLAFWNRRGERRSLVARDQLAVGRTHHVVGTYGRKRMRLYVDGKLVSAKKLRKRVTVRKNRKPLWIGRYGSSRRGGGPFHGVIDEVAIYRKAQPRRKVGTRYAAGGGTNPQWAGGDTLANAAPPPRNAPPPLWSGDFEVGGYGQYDAVQEAADDRIALTSLVRKGRFASRLTAHDDDGQGGGNPRAQLMSRSQHFPGQEHYIGWSTFFPPDFPAIRGDGAFFVFFQFHGKPYSGSPPLGLSVGGDGRMDLRRNEQYGFDRLWSTPLPRGRWIDFVVHVKWSKSAADGFVELWVDGVQQPLKNGQRRVHTQTVMSDQNEGLKTIATNYRRKGIIPGAVTLYHDEVKVGTSYDSVAP